MSKANRVVFVAMLAWGSVWKTSPELYAQDLCLIIGMVYWLPTVLRFNRVVFWISDRL